MLESPELVILLVLWRRMACAPCGSI